MTWKASARVLRSALNPSSRLHQNLQISLQKTGIPPEFWGNLLIGLRMFLANFMDRNSGR